MSDQSNSTGAVSVVVTEAKSFVTDSLDLKSLNRSLKSLSKTALDKIELLLKHEDPKVALAAAQFILNSHIQVTKDMNTDKLQRLIAQVKLGNGRKELIPVSGENDEEEEKPSLDFSTIREVK